ncbi:MAG: hypothetical protein CVU54_03635, partial [Deltaproteobacteria bacterium HGW-Deltaproteobacteria-12]
MNKPDKTRQQLFDELQKIKPRMKEAEETLRAILSGEVDGLVVETGEGDRVFTLSGADLPYRIMVETMNEGAVTLAADGTILFCNQRFADLFNKSLEKIIGSSIYPFFSSTDLPLFKGLLRKGLEGTAKMELAFQIRGKNSIPVLLSLSALKFTGISREACMVVTDLTQQKLNEEMRTEEIALQKAHDQLEKKVEERTVELKKALSEVKTMKDQLEAENVYFRQESKLRNRYENIIGQSDGL